jgi:hypothetical protein
VTIRSYYFHSRKEITFTKVIQSILFENAPEEVAVLNKWDPNARHKPDALLLDRYFMHRYFDSRKLYSGEKYSFNFVTCHGLKNTASMDVYLKPFDFWTWLVLAFILAITSLIVSATAILILTNI